jgi:cell division protein FtsW
MSVIDFAPNHAFRDRARGAQRRRVAGRSAERANDAGWRLRLAPVVGEATIEYWLLLTLVVVLNLVGLVMVLSASSVMSLETTGSSWTYAIRQAMWMALGFVALAITLRIDLSFWRHNARRGLVIAVGLLLVVLVPGLGVSANGSTRWVGFGQLQLQPSEFAKLALLIFVADLLARRADRVRDSRFSIRPVMVVTAVFGGLLMLQPNLGTTILLGCIVMVMLFIAGAPGGPLLGCGLGGAFAAVVLAMSAPYRRARLLGFLHPWSDPSNTGYQVIQSQVGLADGHLLGAGLGASRAKWGFLPYAHTDFIFAIIGEELGLVGAIAVVLLFVALAVLGVRTAMRSRDRFGMLVAAGVTAWLSIQALVNIGAVIGVLPVTGVPLPFISFGGSSLLFTLVASGLLLNVARNPAKPARHPGAESSRNGVGRSRHPRRRADVATASGR